MSGALLFGFAQCGWAYAPAVLCPVVAVGVICPVLPDPLLHEFLAAFAQPQLLGAMLVVLLAGLPLIPRLGIPTEGMERERR